MRGDTWRGIRVRSGMTRGCLAARRHEGAGAWHVVAASGMDGSGCEGQQIASPIRDPVRSRSRPHAGRWSLVAVRLWCASPCDVCVLCAVVCVDLVSPVIAGSRDQPACMLDAMRTVHHDRVDGVRFMDHGSPVFTPSALCVVGCISCIGVAVRLALRGILYSSCSLYTL